MKVTEDLMKFFTWKTQHAIDLAKENILPPRSK